MQTQSSENNNIKLIIQFSTIILFLYKAGKQRPTCDYYESNSIRINHNHIFERQESESCNYSFQKIDSSTLNSDDKKSSEKSNLYKRVEKIFPLALKYYKFSFVVNIYLLIKYTIICALDTNHFEEYRYLDCILIGRVNLDGRAAGFSRHYALYHAIAMIAMQILMYFCENCYNLDPLELMLTDVDELMSEEFAVLTSRSNHTFEDQQIYEQIFGKTTAVIGSESGNKNVCKGVNLLKVAEYFNCKKSNITICSNEHGHKWQKRLRPIKTVEAWIFIARNFSMYTVAASIGVGILILLIVTSQIPLMVTKLGFVLTHENCASWIVKSFEQSQLHGYNSLNEYQKFSLKHIYQPKTINSTITNEMKAIWLKMEDFIDLNLYHCFRILISQVEIICFFFIEIALFYSNLMLILVNIRYVYFYIIFMKRKLELYKRNLHKINSIKQISHSTSNNINEIAIELQGQQIQSMMIDMFKTIKSCNIFVSKHVTIILSMWLGYSAFITGWMFQPGDFFKTSKLESYFIHAFATLYLCLLTGALSKVKRESIELYKLSTSCMALTNNQFESKTRWVDIMRFYYPRHLNCFRMFENSQMCWFLAIRIVASLFSALFVASTFYAYYQ